MSGIYGVVEKKKLNRTKYSALSKWNQGYGDLNEQYIFEDNVYFGIKPEKVRGCETELDKFVHRYENRVAVIDAFIFSKSDDTLSDTEYLFEEICKKGIDTIKTVNGDFAGVIWNTDSHEMILFRDHMGVRPLFYYHDPERVIFSTDIRGITSVIDVDTAVNEDWLYRDLQGASILSATDTEYKRIKCVPFGGYVVFGFSSKEVTKKEYRYWIPGEKRIRKRNRVEYTKELKKLVEDAIVTRLNASTLKFGSELSGGLDSGVIDLILAGLRKDIVYYSWTPDEKYLPLAENDERLIIADICKAAGIECNFGGLGVKVDDDELIEKRFMVPTNEKYRIVPYFVKYSFPNYINSSTIYETAAFMKKKGVKFVFTGHGGDEGISHRGNPYELIYYHEYYRYLRLMFSRSSISKHRILKTIELIKENLTYARNELLKPFLSEEISNPIICAEFLEKSKRKELPFLFFAYDPKKYIEDGGSRNRLDVVAFYDSCTEVRYLAPLLDYRVVDYALGIPRYLYFNWYYSRYIFREAFKDIMPKSLYWLKAKESNSYKSLKLIHNTKDEVSFDEVIAQRKSFLNYLDESYWKKYLDFAAIDDWIYGRLDKKYDEIIIQSLNHCIQNEHMVKRSRELSDIK